VLLKLCYQLNGPVAVPFRIVPTNNAYPQGMAPRTSVHGSPCVEPDGSMLQPSTGAMRIGATSPTAYDPCPGRITPDLWATRGRERHCYRDICGPFVLSAW
jgi:hypothetical protein